MFTGMEPTLIKTPNGWLAITPPTYPLRIGVAGPTAAEASARFTDAVRAWERLATEGEEA